MTPKTIAFSNQKGGVGKTTLTRLLGLHLLRHLDMLGAPLRPSTKLRTSSAQALQPAERPSSSTPTRREI